MLGTIIFVIFISLLSFIILSAALDYRKKRVPTRLPFISFIVPCYNVEKSIEQCVKSIFHSYDKKNFELFVINDCSKDKTLEKMKKLNKDYNFRIVNNQTNLGKPRSINNVFKKTKGEIIFIVDSDTIINETAVREVVARLEDKKVGAAGCRCKPRNSGLLAEMQRIEYGMASMIQTSYNRFGALSTWGACFGVRRDVFQKMGMFKLNVLQEDVDLFLRMNREGIKTQECSVSVYTYVPGNLKSWFKQKTRWQAGYVQNLINHYDVMLKHPINVIFMIVNGALTISFAVAIADRIIYVRGVYGIFENLRNVGMSFITSIGIIKIVWGIEVLEAIGMSFLFPLFSLPYLAINTPDIKKRPYKILWLFPYAMLYYPMFVFVSIWGMIVGMYKYFKLRNAKRGW
jgi:cellulose synthase/poly-beta-1,6-N-acetylglucosamine synthase-like glycosyltransferase